MMPMVVQDFKGVKSVLSMHAESSKGEDKQCSDKSYFAFARGEIKWSRNYGG